MTEELKAEGGEQVVEQTQEQVAVSPIEQRAMEMGWRPREEFDGSDDDFIDAKEFVRRKPLFDAIEEKSRRLRNVEKTLETFKGHYSKVKEVEYARALADLKKERKQAIIDGDVDALEAAEEKISEVQTQVEEMKQVQAEQPEEPTAHPVFVNWVNRNKWYQTTPHMRVYADEIGLRLQRQGLSPDEVLKQVEKAVKDEFPNKFVNPNKASAPSVSSPSRQGRASASDAFDMPAEDKRIMDSLVRSGTITKEEYMKDYKKIHGLQ